MLAVFYFPLPAQSPPCPTFIGAELAPVARAALMPINRLLALVPDVRVASEDLAHYPKDTQRHLLGPKHCNSSNRELICGAKEQLCHLWPCSTIQDWTRLSGLPHTPQIIHSHFKDTCSQSHSLSRKSLCDLMFILRLLPLTTQFIKLILKCHLLTRDGGCNGQNVLKSLTPRTSDVTAFTCRAFKEVMKVKWDHTVGLYPKQRDRNTDNTEWGTTLCRHSEKTIISKPRREISWETQPADTLLLDFLPEKINFCC